MLFAGLPVWLNWGNYGSKANFLTDILYYLELAFLGYINNLLLIPRLMDKGKVRSYFAVIFFLVLVVAYAALFWITPLVSDYTSRLSRPYVRYLFNLADYFFFVGSFTGAALLVRLAKSKRRSAQLSEQQQLSELNFLRAQINPHLLFNTLNMFYGAAQEKSEKLPDMMLGLANAMRYALQEGSQDRVLLSREIDFLHNYVDLQRMRLEGRANVSFIVHTAGLSLKIPPLLFIVLVENAFKYAADHHVDGIVINLRLEVKHDMLFFRTENNVGDALAGSEATGLGLANLRQRLHLIYTERSAELHTLTASGMYIAELTLPLEFAPVPSLTKLPTKLIPS